MSNERKHHTPEEKVTILRRHLVDKVPVSTLCDEHQIHPTVFYRWLKQFFENGVAAFGPAPRTDKQVEALERLASASSGGPPGALERQAVEQGEGLPAAPGAARALARGYLLPQSGGHLLLPLQRVGRLQPLLGALGDSRSDDRSRSRDHF